MSSVVKNEFMTVGILGALLLLLIVVAVEDFPSPLALLRLILGLAFILIVPGYFLQAALFPGAGDLDGPERAALSFGLSVTIIPFIVLLLDRLPWGIFQWPIVITEMLIINLSAATLWYRRRRLPAEERYTPRVEFGPRTWWAARDRATRRLFKVLGIAFLMAFIAISALIFLPNPEDSFTEFYLVGPEGLAENYPRQTAVDESLNVNMGIANQERREQSYRVEVWAVDPWTGQRQLINAAGPFELDKGESLEQPIEWQMPWVGDDQQVEFYLFAADVETTEPYRLLRLWLNVVGNEASAALSSVD